MRAVTTVLACGLVLTLVGCGDSPEKIAADQLAILSDMNDVLGGITDEASVEAATPKLKALGERAKDLNARAEKVAAPSQEQIQAIREKHKEQAGKEFGRLFANFARLSEKPEVFAAVQNATPDVQGGPEWLSSVLQVDMGMGAGEIQFEMHDMPEMPEMPAFPEGPAFSPPDGTNDESEQP